MGRIAVIAVVAVCMLLGAGPADAARKSVSGVDFAHQARDMRRLDEAAAALSDEAVDKTALAGRAETVTGRIVPALRPGITGITIRPHAPPGRSVDGVLRSFAESVIPRLGGS